jgi:hypothetical protein
VVTQRARMQQRPSSATASVYFMCRLVLCGSWLECGPVEKKETASTIPAESHVAVCMPAARNEAI